MLLILYTLELFSDPHLNISISYVSEFNSNFRAVSFLQRGEKISQFPVFLLRKKTANIWEINMVSLVEITLYEPISSVVQPRLKFSVREIELSFQ